MNQLRIFGGFLTWAFIPHRPYRSAVSPIAYDPAARAAWRDMVESATVTRPT